MDSSATFNRQEILQVADAVAREKGIAKEIVLEAMEEAIQKAGRAKYGVDNDIRANIDPRTGELTLIRVRTVVEEVEDSAKELTVEDARYEQADAVVGTELIEELPPIDFGRIAAQTAKQVIVQKVREAERDRQYDEFRNRVGEIINGVVKRADYGHLTIDLGRSEAVIRRDQQLPRESFRRGDRIRAYLLEVRREQRGPQIFMSRTNPQFMAKLFAQEVPEIYDGIIEIKGVARDPGSRAKLAVTSNDSSIDPVGACVGLRGSRVQAVVNELQGEKIDIIQWSPDVPTFIVNALAPAEVAKVVLDEDANRIEVVVPDDQLSLAIGRRGQNVRLASQLTGWDIDIMTESDESERRQKEFQARSQLFIDSLNVDEVIAQLIVTEGFSSIEEVAYVEPSELAAIEGFDESVAEELQNRARDYLQQQDEAAQERCKELGLAEDLLSLEGLSAQMMVAVGEQDIKTRDDLAELASDELLEILPKDSMTEDEANELIMRARAHWFEDEEEAPAAEEPAEEVGEEAAEEETLE